MFYSVENSLLGSLSYGAGIQQNNIGIFDFIGFGVVLGQNRADYFRVVDVHLAAIGLYVKSELFSIEGVGGGC